MSEATADGFDSGVQRLFRIRFRQAAFRCDGINQLRFVHGDYLNLRIFLLVRPAPGFGQGRSSG